MGRLRWALWTGVAMCAGVAWAAPGADDASMMMAEDKPMTKATTDVAAASLGTLPEGIGTAVGSKAPTARLQDAAGKPVKLGSWYGQGPTLVVFYRGGWCPYCNHQVRELSQAADGFAARGVQPVLISVDRIEKAASTQASWEIPYPVLSDPDLRAHDAFGVVHQVSPEMHAKLLGWGLDLEDASGKAHHKIAVPSVFLVDGAGTVRWAHADPTYTVRPSVPQLFAAIDATLGADAAAGE